MIFTQVSFMIQNVLEREGENKRTFPKIPVLYFAFKRLLNLITNIDKVSYK